MQCIKPTPKHLTIHLADQTLSYQNKVFPISSSRFGIGFTEGSNKTPLGRFQISEKHGAGEHIHSVFKGRRKVSQWSPDNPELSKDHILARILRLSGLEGDNNNTYQRYIYIHGTNNEQGIGTPHSMGCIRLRNLDMIELYNTVDLGTTVSIY